MSIVENQDKPLVAIFMVTYNHEKYIYQAIESVLSQKVNFKIKLFIGEDCSTDNTRAICQDYEKKYPDIIELICTKENNITVNAANVKNACIKSGAKYIALCEGDDYWIDPFKLQKQVDFLEKNPDFSICFSAVEVFDEMGRNWPDEKYFPKLIKDVFTIEDFILSGMNIIPTPTMIFRNVLPNPLPLFFENAVSGDICIQLLVADKGKAKYLQEKTAVYRNHSGGITKSKENIEKGNDRLMKLYGEVNGYLKFKYDSVFRKRFLANAKYNLISEASGKHGLRKIKHYFKRMPDYIKYSDKIDYKEIVYYHFVLFFPSLLRKYKKKTILTFENKNGMIMFGVVKKKIHTLKKLIINHIIKKRRKEDNAYWQLCDEHDFPKQITAKLHVFYEEKLKELTPDIESYNKDIYNFQKNRYSKYLYEIKDCFIDPDETLVLLNQKYFFRYSYPMMEDPWGVMQPRPSKKKFLSQHKNVLNLEKAILVNYSWSNYYHFLIDELPQFGVCDEYGLSIDIPVIVPEIFSKTTFVQDYFNKVHPTKRKIIIQSQDQYIHVDELYIAKDVFFSDHIFNYSKNIIKDHDIIGPQKIFIKRAINYGRTIINMEEIESLLKDHGYMVIEPGDFTIIKQMNLFSNVTEIVGVHGAAITNMVFTQNKNVRLIEIFKGGEEFADHYKNLAAVFGFTYKLVAGGIPDEKNNFYLDKNVLLKALD